MIDEKRLKDKIQEMVNKAKKDYEEAVAIGYDEGWYAGNVNAFSEVLNLLKILEKNEGEDNDDSI